MDVVISKGFLDGSDGGVIGLGSERLSEVDGGGYEVVGGGDALEEFCTPS